jgi:hypothetical protein
VLDLSERSPLHAGLLHEGTAPLRTVYEADFGQPLAEVLWAPAVYQAAAAAGSGGGGGGQGRVEGTTANGSGGGRVGSGLEGSVLVSM